MSRPRHKCKEFEDLLRVTEEQGWKVTGGGSSYFKMKCPRDCKCMKMVHLTPSDPNYYRNLVNQLRRTTCWKEA